MAPSNINSIVNGGSSSSIAASLTLLRDPGTHTRHIFHCLNIFLFIVFFVLILFSLRRSKHTRSYVPMCLDLLFDLRSTNRATGISRGRVFHTFCALGWQSPLFLIGLCQLFFSKSSRFVKRHRLEWPVQEHMLQELNSTTRGPSFVGRLLNQWRLKVSLFYSLYPGHSNKSYR